MVLPQHAGDNFQDPSEPGPASWARRPVEVSQAIDRVAADNRLAPLLRFDAVGVFGGSAGGHTALSLAGGQWSPSRFRDHCLQHIDEDFSSCVGFVTLRRGDGLDALKDWAARLVIRARFSDTTPQRHTDPRIGAVVAMVPFAADFDPESLRRPVVPLGLVIADQDINRCPAFTSKRFGPPASPDARCWHGWPRPGTGPCSRRCRHSSGSVGERLLGDPPAFDRSTALPPLHAAIAEFFVQRLGPSR
ncbi:dienelactone hydrolase [Piscinibacter aquaticus]|uniref:Dienelactone hydrolase n=1 Tax=Piscinibacter aquaticus TaxID=392597 RepID=A0A5C6U294_9BURK|nr:dienelactone hydrolase [Piscinibacter aquaticus]